MGSVRRHHLERVDPRRLILGLTVLSVAVLAIGHVAIALSRSHAATSDWASIEMRTRDVFSRHPPLIGAWSRYEWSHPGPLMFYVLAIPYRLGGQTWQAMWVGAVLVNVAALAAAVWLAARRSTALGTTVLLAGLATVAGFRSHLLSDDWNATMVVLPVLTVLVAAVGARCGDRRALPVLVLAYMFVAQCHFGYGVVLLPVAAWAAAESCRRRPRPTVRWLAVGVALWLPVAIDTLANWPGNFLTSIGWNLTADEPARGVGESLRVVGRATSFSFLSDPGVPSFDVSIDHPAAGTFPFAALVALAVAWWLAVRVARARATGALAVRRAIEVVGVTWLVGLVAVARIKGPLYRWIVDWTYPLAALTWALVVLVVVQVLVRNRLIVATMAATAALTFSVVNVAGSVGEPYINAQWVPIVRQFSAAAEARVGRDPILVDLEGDKRLTGAVQSGMVNRMELDGFEARVRADQGLQFGGHRRSTTVADHLLVRSEAVVDPLAGAEVVSVWDPLTAAERAEADRLTRELGAVLTENGLAAKVPILDTPVADLASYQGPPAVIARQADFDRLAALRRIGERVVLYFVRISA